MSNTFTKHCNIVHVQAKDGTCTWKIYLSPEDVCQDEVFSFGLPLLFNFDSQEDAHKAAVDMIDPLIDRWIEDITDQHDEQLLAAKGE